MEVRAVGARLVRAVAASGIGAVLLAAPAASAREQAKPRYGGTVTVGLFGEPTGLNALAGDKDIMVLCRVLAAPYRITPEFEFRPWLISRVRVRRNPFRLTYYLRPDARWSDGRPITGEDLVFSAELIKSLPFPHFKDLVSARVLGPRSAMFTYARAVGWWKGNFSCALFPKHALEGLDFTKVWHDDLNNPRTGKPIGSGPFLFSSWRRGHSITLVRNERYSIKRAYLSRLVFRFFPDVQAAAQAMRQGTVDVVSTQLDPAVASLRGMRGIRVRTTLGANWELLQFNLGYLGGGNPLLRRRFVRDAIARAVDRRMIVRQLYADIAPGVPVNNSAFVPPQSRYAKPWWGRYAFDPVASRRILERNGCRRGPDRVYVCAGSRLSFRLATTTGNQLRELTVLIMQRNLRRAGIEVRIDNAAPPVLFQRKGNGDYDLIVFAWNSSPQPLGYSNLYGCRTASDALLNDIGYCNPRVDALLRAANGELEESRQYARTNEALKLMAHDLPILPLFQKPTLLAYRTALHGVRDNASEVGPMWNVEWWWKERPR